MKIEFLHHWHRHHGLSLKERLIAYLPRYAPWAARLAPVMNVLQRLAKQPLLGFAAQRSLPAWRSDAFVASEAKPANAGREVVLFVDTFNTYFEPENARAAVKVLEAAGYAVRMPRPVGDTRPLCCGRTFLAGGLVSEARKEAQRMMAVLKPYVERGVPVVGLEPSCLFSLRDEFLSLLPGADASKLAQNAMLFEEFIVREHEAGRLDLQFRVLPQTRALLHGHCHQKAFAVMPAVRKALALVPDLNVELIESSCCGMAGSFGYEAKHHDVSMRMAEVSLLPKVREADTNALIIADGTSCRHQIHDGAAREALHVARVLAAALP